MSFIRNNTMKVCSGDKEWETFIYHHQDFEIPNDMDEYDVYCRFDPNKKYKLIYLLLMMKVVFQCSKKTY